MTRKNRGILTVVSGFSGAGKGTIMKELMSKYSDQYALSISATTRGPRPGETDGVEYFFKTREEFEQMIEAEELVEYAQYVGNYYGTPKKKVEDLIDEGSNVFLKIEVEGAGNIRKVFPEVVSVFIVPPSMEELASRLKGRGTETEETFNRRFNIARNELLRASEYDYIVINDSVSECADRICAILNAEASRYIRMKTLVDNMN